MGNLQKSGGLLHQERLRKDRSPNIFGRPLSCSFFSSAEEEEEDFDGGARRSGRSKCWDKQTNSWGDYARKHHKEDCRRETRTSLEAVKIASPREGSLQGGAEAKFTTICSPNFFS